MEKKYFIHFYYCQTALHATLFVLFQPLEIKALKEFKNRVEIPFATFDVQYTVSKFYDILSELETQHWTVISSYVASITAQ